LTRSAHQDQERISGHAEKQIETKIEVEDASRRQEALQVHGERQDQARALRQTALDGHQGARPHAQAEEVDAGEQGGRGQRQADASVRIRNFNFVVILSEATEGSGLAGKNLNPGDSVVVDYAEILQAFSPDALSMAA
jgi:hypothetical protein